jgi:hypothetical protein
VLAVFSQCGVVDDEFVASLKDAPEVAFVA